MDARDKRFLATLERELAAEWYGQANGGNRNDIVMRPDGTCERWTPGVAKDEHVLVIYAASGLEEWHGDCWSDGLDTDEDGNPIVTEEIAQEWAVGWIANCSTQALADRDYQEEVEAEARRLEQDL